VLRRSFFALPALAFQPERIHTPYVETPPDVVDAMLDLAGVHARDLVYDLGSGDGRVVIAAAKRFCAKAVGIENHLERVRQARENARLAGVANLVRFVHDDFFAADLSEATVVFLYLLPEVNLELRPKLWRELKPGSRVVSHEFGMGDWKPQRTIEVRGAKVHKWLIPPT